MTASPLSSPDGPAPRGGGLPRAVMDLSGLLKRAGAQVHPGSVQDALRSLTLIDVSSEDDLRWALKINLVQDPGQYARFDQFFDQVFWGRRPEDDSGCRPPEDGQEPGPGVESTLDPTAPPEGRMTPYSPVEILRHRDLAGLNPDEQEQARRLIRELVRPLALKRSRRYRPARKGRQVHFRRTMRRSLQSGGELVDLFRRARRPRRRQLVLLADVSGSMDPYLPFVLALVTSLGRLGREVSVFTFATRLTEISGLLRHADPRQVLTLLGRRVPDWSGGTRIGSALEEFNLRYAPRLAPAKTVVLIYSDGWDRGTPDLLAAQMARLAGFAHRVVWLNPLLKSPRYEPTCQGMEAALPFVDGLLPVHTIGLLGQAAEAVFD